MKVIVNESGFIAGTWYEKSQRTIEMNDRVARPFLPPYGHQLAAAPPAAAAKSTEKVAEKKAG